MREFTPLRLKLKPMRKEAIPKALEKAEALRPPDNDDAALRWNACVRMIRDQHLKPRQEERLVLTSE